MKYNIESDLTVAGTKILKDGFGWTEDEKIASIAFFADAPNKKYNEDGHVSMSVTTFDAEGNVKRQHFSKNPEMTENCKPIGMEDESNFKIDDFVHFLGTELIDERIELVDSIINYCTEKNIPCVERDVLSKRSLDSLRDKSDDLGISSVNS